MTQLVSFVDVAGNAVAVNPTSVLMLSEVPGNPAQTHIDMTDASLPRIAVAGTLVATGTALLGPGTLALALFTPLGGAPALAVNPDAISAVYPVAGGLSTYLDMNNARVGRIAVTGSLAVTLATLLATNAGNTPGSADYAPLFSASGGGVVGVLGQFRALRIGRQVFVLGKFTFTPAVNLVPELITISLVPGLPPDPSPFVNASDAAGSASAEDGTSLIPGQVRATVGGTTVELDVTSLIAGDVVAVVFSYETA